MLPEMGERLDRFLARANDITRSQAERAIRQGRACVNGLVHEKPGNTLKPTDLVTMEIPPPIPIAAEPQNIALDILYEDACLAVILKPCGMVVHPAAGNTDGTLVNALLYHLEGLSGIGGALRPGIVHRLDKDTSGLILVAKDDKTHQALSSAFQNRTIDKTYTAIVQGRPKPACQDVHAPIGRHPTDRKRMAIVPNGRDAHTRYTTRETLRGASWLDIDLFTGRTHQIRVHLAALGHPVFGDAVYKGPKASRLMLHAWKIAFVHPHTGEKMAFEAPIPHAFDALASTLRFL